VLLSHPATEVQQLLGAPFGCALRSAQRVWLLNVDQGITDLELKKKASAIGVGAGQLLVATSRTIRAFDAAGSQVAQSKADPAIAVLTQFKPRSCQRSFCGEGCFVVGYTDGTVRVFAANETSRADVAAEPSSLSFEQAPVSVPVRMLLGPADTLAVGYANGDLGLWSLCDGERLMHEHLHGPVIHLRLDDRKLYAATELEAHLVWDLEVFYLSACDLLRRVWRTVPVQWRNGHPELSPVPTDHPCSEVD